MPNLKVKPSGKTGRVTHVTPENAGWTYVGFDLYRLKPGETASGETGEREVCLVGRHEGFRHAWRAHEPLRRRAACSLYPNGIGMVCHGRDGS